MCAGCRSLSSPRSSPSRWSLQSASATEHASLLLPVRPAASDAFPTPIEHIAVICRWPGPRKTKSATMAPWSLFWGMRWNEGDWVRCECCGSVCKVLVTSEGHKVGLESTSPERESGAWNEPLQCSRMAWRISAFSSRVHCIAIDTVRTVSHQSEFKSTERSSRSHPHLFSSLVDLPCLIGIKSDFPRPDPGPAEGSSERAAARRFARAYCGGAGRGSDVCWPP